MSNIQYSNEIREQAFLFWYEERNDSAVVRKLKEAGYSITRATVSKWKEKYKWEERASHIDIKKQTARDESVSFEESLILDLQKQKERYDVYFDSLEAGKVDNQAMFVYNQLCEKLINLRSKILPTKTKKSSGLSSSNLEEIKRQILGIG